MKRGKGIKIDLVNLIAITSPAMIVKAKSGKGEKRQNRKEE
jgi:hypothetical protein